MLEIGWGDRAYYTSPDPSVWLALRAGLAPTEAVLHVGPRDGPPEAGTPDAVRFPLSRPRFEALAAALSAQWVRPSSGAPAAPLGPGLRPGALFYAARGRFHLFNTCNSWTARMLAAAGLPIAPEGVITADALMDRARAAAARE